MEGRRIFAAIEISDQARESVSHHIAGLKREFPNVRVGWVRPEKLHITVKFAGKLDNAELAALTARVDAGAVVTEPFVVTINGTGAFVKRNASNVLWLGLDAAPLGGLAAAFDSAGVAAKPMRSFKPHLTIARLREPRNSSALIDRHLATRFEPVEFIASEVVIFESTLLPTGSIYKVVSRHPFTGQD